MKFISTLVFTFFLTPFLYAQGGPPAFNGGAEEAQNRARIEEDNQVRRISRWILLEIYPDSLEWATNEFIQVRNEIEKMVRANVLRRTEITLWLFLKDAINSSFLGGTLPSFQHNSNRISFYAGVRMLDADPRMPTDPDRTRKLTNENWRAIYATTAFVNYYLKGIIQEKIDLDFTSTNNFISKPAIKIATTLLPFIKNGSNRTDLLFNLLRSSRNLSEFVEVASLYLYEVYVQNKNYPDESRTDFSQAWSRVLAMATFRFGTSHNIKGASDLYKVFYENIVNHAEMDFFKRHNEHLGPLAWLHDLTLQKYDYGYTNPALRRNLKEYFGDDVNDIPARRSNGFFKKICSRFFKKNSEANP